MKAGVRISGWRKGAEVVSAVRVLLEGSSLGLAEAKRTIEKVLEGGEVEVGSTVCRDLLVSRLRECGFEADLSGE